MGKRREQHPVRPGCLPTVMTARRGRPRGNGAVRRGATLPQPSAPTAIAPALEPRPATLDPGGSARPQTIPSPWKHTRWIWLGPLLTALGTLAVYLRTLHPSLPTGDSGELIATAVVLGVPHPPGYPLFTMVGHLFSLLPFGAIAWRVNLMSAVFGAAAVGLVALTVYRAIQAWAEESSNDRIRPWQAACAGAIAGLGLAFSTAFWMYSIVAEVFAINSFFTALLLFLILEWHRQPQNLKLFWIFAYCCGLAASNHHTIVLLAPAFLVLLVSGARRLFPRVNGRLRNPHRIGLLNVLPAIPLLALGLVPYVYLPIAARMDPALNWGDPETLQTFIRHVTRADYGTFSLTVQDNAERGHPIEQVAFFARYLFNAFSPLGYLLAAAGAWWLARRRMVEGAAILLAFLVAGPAFVGYANPFFDNEILKGVIERFYIMPSVPFALLVGFGAMQVTEALQQLAPARLHALRLAASFAVVLLLLVPVGTAAAHFATVDQSGNYVDWHFGRDLLRYARAERDAAHARRRGDHGGRVSAGGRALSDRRDRDGHGEAQTRVVRPATEARPSEPVDPVQRLRRGQLLVVEHAHRPGARRVDRSILVGTPKEKDFGTLYEAQKAGLTSKVLPRGSGQDVYQVIRDRLSFFMNLHYPIDSTRSPPSSLP